MRKGSKKPNPVGRPPKDRLKATAKATPKQRKFVEAYVDADSETYLNATRSYMTAYDKAYDYANSHGHEVLKSPAVRLSIQERLNREKIDDLIEDGLTKILKRPGTPGAYLRAVELIAKMRGLFAPEKHLNMNLTPEQRQDAYRDLLRDIETKINQSKQPTKALTDESQSSTDV